MQENPDKKNKKTRGRAGKGSDRGGQRGYGGRQSKGWVGGRKVKVQEAEEGSGEGAVRLNRFLAQAGICSRREADRLILSGVIEVNGKVVTRLGTQVLPTDRVQYGGETIRHEKKQYVLLNKPKDYITTSADPRNRRTVLELVKDACRERIYPVGRLDRNTTGLLLLTNDGDLATRLMHPRARVPKVYHATLDRRIEPEDMDRISGGIELDDGRAKVDQIGWIAPAEDRKLVGIQIHSGRYHIIRRIFEALGYKVVKLDRVTYAGLSKKNLPRGKWRHLTAKEVGFLKML